MTPLETLRSLFDTAIAAAQPELRIPQFLPAPPAGRTVVVGAGKSAAAMARAVEQVWPGPLEGVVVTRYGHGVPTERIQVLEAAHPVPDEKGRAAAEQIWQTVAPLGPEDLVLCLISGGGSALLTLPPEDISLAILADINRQLLRSGADIVAMNTVRKTLSRSSGGRLAAAAYPAQVVSLLISDVPGDNLRAIASGPTVGDTVTAQDTLGILIHYAIDVPPVVLDYLQRDPNPVIAPSDPRLATTTNHLIATPQQSLEAAAAKAQALGYTPLILGSAIEGEAKQVGIVHSGIAHQVVQYGQPITPPCVILSGGETTVTVTGSGGRGGRNGEFLLSLAVALNGLEKVWAIAGDTDGIDGSETNAGAILTPDILQRGGDRDLNAADYLARHDSYSFFAALDALVDTGPTLTNVNDFRAILIEP
ncbi:glycerate kinase [Leptolyngbya sp. PCC 6406]|uniref:glycerate kinase type-2 family protein n=1 Tax=Leptolyngbya sp. PCC 6406 TaxID=1173264 RepID=UPI0002ACF238|nr:glycerate kinase [Leptolyngbya sp. PCC 6406]